MLSGKVAVITGASSGIGAAVSRVLAGEDARVVLAARRIDLLEKLARELNASSRKNSPVALPVQCDVTVRAQAEQLIQRAIAELGRIDILVNNAGQGQFAGVEDTTDEMIEHMFRLNAFALWYTTRPALVQMKKQGTGHIINMASMAGKIGYPFNSAYVAAKHACVGFTHALRMELVETDIHASVVCPAGVNTPWASMTEGGPMLPFFHASGPIIKEIARSRNLPLPAIEGLLPPEQVAKKILECIYNPVAELYIHAGSEEFVRLAARDRPAAEREQLPVVLGERAVYERIRHGDL